MPLIKGLNEIKRGSLGRVSPPWGRTNLGCALTWHWVQVLRFQLPGCMTFTYCSPCMGLDSSLSVGHGHALFMGLLYDGERK